MTQDEQTAWETGWDDHEVRQLRRLAGLTLVQKLEWLEQADAVVRHLSESRRRSADAGDRRANGVHE